MHVHPKSLACAPTPGHGSCSDCGGRGVLVGPQGKVRYCRCLLERALAHRMREAGFTDPEHHRASFDLDPDVEAKLTVLKDPIPESLPEDPVAAMRELYRFVPLRFNEFLREYSDLILQELRRPSRHLNLLLYGPTGSGKTYAAAAVARRLFLHGYEPVFTTAENLVQTMIRAARSPEHELKQQRYFHADLVVLDELGYEDAEREQVLAKITEFLRYRHRARLPVIATSNLLIVELMRRYGTDHMSIFHEWFKVWVSKREDHRITRARGQEHAFSPRVFLRGS